MKVSDAIAELENIKASYGDIEVEGLSFEVSLSQVERMGSVKQEYIVRTNNDKSSKETLPFGLFLGWR